MERTITKKQLQALIKVCSKDTTRPAIMRLALRYGKLWATDGYVMVMLNLHDYEDQSELLIDPDKLKMKLAVMKPKDGLTIADLRELKDENEYRYPEVERLTTGMKGDGSGVNINPEVLARACNAIADPTGEAIWNMTTTYNESHLLTMTNKLGDMAIVMGGNK